MGVRVTAYVENLDKVLENLDKIQDMKEFDQALLQEGLKVEADAKRNLIVEGRVKTGLLVGSIKTELSDDNEVKIYTNAPYATYVEYGTGAFAEAGNGRKGWWVYVDEECGAPKSKNHPTYTYDEAVRVWHILASQYGEKHVHITQGQRPVKFMRRAYLNNRETIINDLQEYINRKVKNANA